MNNNQLDISKLSLVELKAIAYDLMTHHSRVQQNLGIVQSEIQRRESLPAPTAQNSVSINPSDISPA
jgi:hypothetical protein